MVGRCSDADCFFSSEIFFLVLLVMAGMPPPLMPLWCIYIQYIGVGENASHETRDIKKPAILSGFRKC
ncbi:hypothetical protein [Synechococcus phage Yong-L1-251]|nr:hypothetical protein [Synechococcus phage Yong-L1-251]